MALLTRSGNDPAEYIHGTGTYILVMLEELMDQRLQLRGVAFLLKYQMVRTVEPRKALMLRITWEKKNS